MDFLKSLSPPPLEWKEKVTATSRMQLLRGALAITVVSATLLLSASAGCALPITGQDVYIITERELYESLPDVNSFQLIFVDDDQDVSNHPQKKASSGNFQMADPYADVLLLY